MASWAVEPIKSYGPDDGRGRGTYVLDENGRVVAIAFGSSWDAAKVNARLIAAAPSLLEALRFALDHAVADPLDEWFSRAKEAVAKAEAV